MKKMIFLKLLMLAQISMASNIFNGRYLMEIQIGDTKFIDDVTIEPAAEATIPLNGFSGNIVGTVNVPDRFSSALNGEVFCNKAYKFCSVDFSIVANENGHSFNVKYSGQTINYEDAVKGAPVIFSGRSYLADGSLLGKFRATQQ
jgi:hypothetical protein